MRFIDRDLKKYDNLLQVMCKINVLHLVVETFRHVIHRKITKSSVSFLESPQIMNHVHAHLSAVEKE